jgi:hypothetical protein
MGRGNLISAMVFLLLWSIGLTMPQAEAQTYTVKGNKIALALVPEKSVFLLGEPIRMSFVVRNLSPHDLTIDIGSQPFSSYDRTGLRLEARRDDGLRVLSRPSVDMTGFAIRTNGTLLAGKSRTVDLFLPGTLTLSRPGKYTLLCHTELKFYPDNHYFAADKSDEITVEASTVLTILPADQRAMGTVIDHLGQTATTEIGKSNPLPKNIQQATESLGAIEDMRVIPWLVKMFKMHSANRKDEAITLLTKFNSSVAFETLKSGLTVRGSELDDCSTREAAAEDVRALRAHAAYALAKSPYPQASLLLKSLLHDPDEEVRQYIVWGLAENRNKDATTMLREMARDLSQKIHSDATYYLEQSVSARDLDQQHRP